MNASQKTLYRALLSELADIERQQEDRTLPHSDQQLLDQAWEDVTNQIDELEAIVEQEECYTCEKKMTEDDVEAWACDDSALDWAHPQCEECRAKPDAENWRDARVVLDASRPGTPVPAEPVRFAPAPPPITRRPVPISIPMWSGSPSLAPPPPRPAGVRICNCDSDGQCIYCEEEELERWNNMVDDRVGCEHCAGCVYCTESRYDGADEI